MCNRCSAEITQQIEMTKSAMSEYMSHSDGPQEYGDGFYSHYVTDSYVAKRELREIFSKFPTWNEKQQTLSVSANHFHKYTDKEIIQAAYDFAAATDSIRDIQYTTAKAVIATVTTNNNLYYIKDCWMALPKITGEVETLEDKIERVIKRQMKPSKKVKRLFEIVGVKINELNMLAWTKLADALNGVDIKYTLFISVAPWAYLTVSNPKYDVRGRTLVSCHSADNEEYGYRKGNCGYGTDGCTFVVFTVQNGKEDDWEHLVSRKSARQLFMFKSGHLMQSRLYSSVAGGGDDDDEVGYYDEWRAIVEKTIATCLSVVNNWEIDNEQTWESHYGFEGYPDWEHGFKFVRRRLASAEDLRSIIVGQSSYCYECGETGDVHEYTGLCSECGSYQQYCHECGCSITSENGYEVDGNVYCCNCVSCCENCGEHVTQNTIIAVLRRGRNGLYRQFLCSDCAQALATPCENCYDWWDDDEMLTIYDIHGNRHVYCPDCAREISYSYCVDCDEAVFDEDCIVINGESYCKCCASNHTDEMEIENPFDWLEAVERGFIPKEMFEDRPNYFEFLKKLVEETEYCRINRVYAVVNECSRKVDFVPKCVLFYGEHTELNNLAVKNVLNFEYGIPDVVYNAWSRQSRLRRREGGTQ